MTRKLEGKVAVVTGGGGGIGGGIARALATEGANVIVNDIGRSNEGISFADKVVNDIIQAGGTAIANYDCVDTMEGGENIIKAATDNFGRIDILVNCAGNFWRVPNILDLTEEVWDAIVATHLKGHFSCTKAAARHMIQQKNGRIFTITSRGAFHGRANLAYASSKAGIIGFSIGLARELKEHNITVNCIMPSAITALFPQDRVASTDNIPLYAKPQPESIAPLIVYLAGDKAQNITGRVIYAAEGDICIYTEPYKLGAANAFIRKIGRWTPDELGDVIPPIMGVG